MDVARPKKKRNELELLLGTGDVGAQSAFSPRLPALSISSPTLPEAAVETDEQLARRLHEELNGTRAARRGSKATVEVHFPTSPGARALASPHSRPKADTSGGAKAHSSAARGNASAPVSPTEPLAAAPTASGGAPVASGKAGDARAVVDGASGIAPAAGGATANASGAGGVEGGGEAAKRKRNVVPARELHLLLQQASSTNARVDSTLSPVRSARAGSASRGDLPAAGPSQQGSQEGPAAAGADAQPPPVLRRESDADRTRGPAPDRPSPSSGSAPVRPPNSPAAMAPSHLPPKLRQRYLAGPPGAALGQPPSASAPACSDAKELAASAAGAPAASAPAVTALTPSGVLDVGRTSLLSGQSVTEGSSLCSQSENKWRERDADAPGRAADGSQLMGASSHAGSGAIPTGASVGGCSSTDETENEHDNGCAAAVAGAGAGGPSATSPKGAPPPPTFPQPSKAQRGGEEEQEDEHPEQQHGQDEEQAAHGGPQGHEQGAGHNGALKVPKLPMVRAGRGWYRGRLVREATDGQRVLLEVPGAPGHSQPVWLPIGSDKIWRGSYKGKDWKYLGDGAWEPKPGAFKRGKQGSSTNGLPLPLPPWAAAAAAEVQLQPADVPPPRHKRERERSGAGAELKHEEQDGLEPRRAGSEEPSAWAQQPRRTSATGTAGTEQEQAAANSASSRSEGGAEEAAEAAAPAEALPAAGVGAAEARAPEAAEVGADDASTAEATAKGNGAASGSDVLPAAQPTVAVKEEEAAPDAEAEPMEVASGPGAATLPLEDVPAAGPEPEQSTKDAAAAAARASGGGTKPARTSNGGAVAAAAPPVVLASCHAAVESGDGASASPTADVDVWAPGAAFPRRHVLRRARQRQQRLRTPLDGLLLYAAPHNGHVMVSGEESGGDIAASDAERAAGRRRAAAKVAALAMEAEAEEDGSGKRQHFPGGNHQRARGGDSSGMLDESYSGEACTEARHCNGSHRGQAGGGACGSTGGSPTWCNAAAAAAWQQGAGAGLAQPPRNRRKGKPCRSRMNGEGDGWDADWELESGVALWARIPECIRRLYYTPAPAPPASAARQAGAAAGGEGQQVTAGARHGSYQQRRCAGYYPEAQAPPANKRRKVYDDDAGVVTPEEEPEPEEEADDPDRDEDYRPPTCSMGRRYNGAANGGRRCSGGGGGGDSGGAGRRGVEAYGAAAAGWYASNIGGGGGGGAVVVTAAAAAHRSSGGSCGLEGLLEAALGQGRRGRDEELHGLEPAARSAFAMGLPSLKQEPGEARPCIALFGAAPPPAPFPPQLAARASHNEAPAHPSHVALSDSSANNSAGEETSRAAGPGAPLIGSGPGTCPASSSLLLLEQSHSHSQPQSQVLPCGGSSPLPSVPSGPPGSAFGSSLNGSPGALRPGTPTRARRTGRPPSAALSAGAPLPKLPALSSSASLRLQLASGPNSNPASAAIGAAVSAAVEAAAAAGAARLQEAAQATQPSTAATAGAAPCGDRSQAAVGTAAMGAQPMVTEHVQQGLLRSGPSPCAQVPQPASSGGEQPTAAAAGHGKGLAGASPPWQGMASLEASSAHPSFAGTDAPAAMACAPSRGAAGDAAGPFAGYSVHTATAGATAPMVVAHASCSPLPSPAGMFSAGATAAAAGGSGCSVVSAIDTLLHEQQPVMQQLTMRAQFELDSMGLVLPPGAAATAHGQAAAALQRQTSSGRRGGRGGGGGGGAAGPLAAAQLLPPPPPEALMAALPSVELVVNLFSARMPCGGTQEALSEFVGGPTSMPLFR